MRFMRGSKVEILSKKEVATGAWICVEIISGNGRTYSVKYGDVVVEKVPRKAMRPCPPPVEGAHNWVRGDLVEVYHNVSWKTATIMKVIGGSSFLVRLLGMLQEFSVQGSHLRLRQSWEDGKWFVIGKGSGNCIMPKSKNQTYTRMESCAGDVRYPIGKDIETLEPKMIFSRKRGSLLNSSHVGAYSKAVHKMRAVEKSDSSLQIIPGHPSTFPEKRSEDGDVVKYSTSISVLTMGRHPYLVDFLQKHFSQSLMDYEAYIRSPFEERVLCRDCISSECS